MADFKCSSLLCENCFDDYMPTKDEEETNKHNERLLSMKIPIKLENSDLDPKEPASSSNKNASEGKTKTVSKCCKKTAKEKRNSGKEYELNTTYKGVRPERRIKPACGANCKYKCANKFSEKDRERLFSLYWGLGNIEMQRQFIANCMKMINPKYRYVHSKSDRNPRQKNNAFHFRCNDQEIRVCKTFFKNTLDINDRPIRTVMAKRHKIADHLLEPDKRGKHGNQPKLDPKLHEGIKKFINTLPRLKKGKNGKTFIEKSKSITALHKDYIKICKDNNELFSNYSCFYRIFTENYNISSKTQKKNQIKENK